MNEPSLGVSRESELVRSTSYNQVSPPFEDMNHPWLLVFMVAVPCTFIFVLGQTIFYFLKKHNVRIMVNPSPKKKKKHSNKKPVNNEDADIVDEE